MPPSSLELAFLFAFPEICRIYPDTFLSAGSHGRTAETRMPLGLAFPKATVAEKSGNPNSPEKISPKWGGAGRGWGQGWDTQADGGDRVGIHRQWVLWELEMQVKHLVRTGEGIESEEA